MKAWVPQIGSVLAAFVASLCCIGPVLAVVLGIGGLGAAAGMEAYRPYFLGVTFLFLGAAFYLTYGRKQKCEEGDVCPTNERAQRYMVLLWIATAVALVLVAAPYLLPLIA